MDADRPKRAPIWLCYLVVIGCAGIFALVTVALGVELNRPEATTTLIVGLVLGVGVWYFNEPDEPRRW